MLPISILVEVKREEGDSDRIGFTPHRGSGRLRAASGTVEAARLARPRSPLPKTLKSKFTGARGRGELAMGAVTKPPFQVALAADSFE